MASSASSGLALRMLYAALLATLFAWPVVSIEDHSWIANVDEELHRFLSEEEEGVGKVGQICGDTTDCIVGLDCTRDVGLKKRCWPSKECLGEKIAIFQETYDMEAIKAQVFDGAGVSELDFLGSLKGLRLGNQNKFLTSKTFQAVKESMTIHLQEPSQKMYDIQRECAMMPKKDEARRKLQDEIDDLTIYFGLHIEAGFLLDGQFQYLAATDIAESREFNRFCVGAELGLGAEVAFIFGAVLYGDIKSFECVAFFGDIDLGLGGTAGSAVGIGLNGRPILEVTGGSGAGFGVGGHVCGTFPSSSNNTFPV